MSFLTLASIVSAIAPTIAQALKTKELAGGATKFLAKKLLGDKSKPIEDIIDAVSNAKTPKITEIKKIENDYKLRLQELEIDAFEIEADIFKTEVRGVADARKRANDTDNIPHIVLSSLFFIGYFSMLLMMVKGWTNVQQEMVATFNILITLLSAILTQIAAYWFGSSFGSKLKNKIIGGNTN